MRSLFDSSRSNNPQEAESGLRFEDTTNSGVVTTNYIANNNAIANQGQLKSFTVAAVKEINSDFAVLGGAGPFLTNLVGGWQQDFATNGYATNTSNPFRP